MSETTTIELRDGDKHELIYIFESNNVPRVDDWVRFVGFGGCTYSGRVESVIWCWDIDEPDEPDDDDFDGLLLSVVVTLTEVEYSVTEDTVKNGRLAYKAEQAAK